VKKYDPLKSDISPNTLLLPASSTRCFGQNIDRALVAKFHPLKATQAGLLLTPAIGCDLRGFLTEKRLYSRLMEGLPDRFACQTQLTVRSMAEWRAGPEFSVENTNDCLRFRPTIATTCYG